MTALEPQFIYPNNTTLKKAMQALIYTVLQERRVLFQPSTLSLAILNYMGWIDDSNIANPDKPEGPNYKKAKNILKTFEGKFTKFRQNGLEVFIFKIDRVRVCSYRELEELCVHDPDMNESVATTEKLDLEQPWRDMLITPTGKAPVSLELALIDNGIKEKHSAIEAQIKDAQKMRLQGIKKGSELAPKELEELKLSSDGIFDELLSNGVSSGNEGKLKSPVEMECI